MNGVYTLVMVYRTKDGKLYTSSFWYTTLEEASQNGEFFCQAAGSDAVGFDILFHDGNGVCAPMAHVDWR